MMRRLIIARHGNTFEDGEAPRRVGVTDLPLTAKGREQAAVLGTWLRERGWIPDAVYAPVLLRSRETAEIAARAAGFGGAVRVADFLAEIDHGPDENKTESEVRLRLGRETLGPSATDVEADAAGHAVLAAWDERAVPPPGWRVDAEGLRERWRVFAEGVARGEALVTFAVTSNGVLRFAAGIGKGEVPSSLKVATGAACCWEWDGGAWVLAGWNQRPA